MITLQYFLIARKSSLFAFTVRFGHVSSQGALAAVRSAALLARERLVARVDRCHVVV